MQWQRQCLMDKAHPKPFSKSKAGDISKQSPSTLNHTFLLWRTRFTAQYLTALIQRHNEPRDLKAELLRVVCNDVEVEPVLQEVTGETIIHGANKAPDARLDIHAPGF